MLCNRFWAAHGEQETVFVDIVQFAEIPEQSPVASRVSLDIRQRFYGVRPKALFYSPYSGVKFLGAITNREVNILKRSGRLSANTNKPVSKMVERASGILDGISREKGDAGWDRSCVRKAIDMLSGCRIILGLERVGVTVNESSPNLFKFEDVFFGPF
jgi:hypothetical protein